MKMFLSSAMLFVMIASSSSSQYDPHVPKGDPWFEGWYTRISETSTGDSIGIVTGYFPSQEGSLANPTAYTALVIDRGIGREVIVKETFPSSENISVFNRNGHPITKNPSSAYENSKFIYRVNNNNEEDQDDEFSIIQEEHVQRLHASYDGGSVRFDANFTISPLTTDLSSSSGVPRFLEPFVGLHWFVYSLGSQAEYRIEIDGDIITGVGAAHQEKNWGTAFPKSWIWGQGGSKSTKLALAGGPAPLGPITIPNTYLIAYQSENVEWAFHPADPSLYSTTIDACAGIFEIEARSSNRRLLVKFAVPGSNSSEVKDNFFNVGGPTRTGFVVDSVESYRANVQVLAYNTSLLHGDILIDAQNLTMAAIEFGGEYRCPE